MVKEKTFGDKLVRYCKVIRAIIDCSFIAILMYMVFKLVFFSIYPFVLLDGLSLFERFLVIGIYYLIVNHIIDRWDYIFETFSRSEED